MDVSVLTGFSTYFKGSRAPFSITLGGEKIYVLTSAQDVAEANKHEAALSYDPVICDLMLTFGVSPDGVDKIYKAKPSFGGDAGRLNPSNKALADLKTDFYHLQLLPRSREAAPARPGEFEKLQRSFLKLIQNSIHPKNSSIHGLAEKDKSLHRWCQSVLVEAGMRAFFGKALFELDPNIMEHFVDFDDNNWMVWYKWPNASAMRVPKAKVLRTLERFLALPKEEKSDMSFLTKAMEDSMKQLGMSIPDMAAVVMMQVWV